MELYLKKQLNGTFIPIYPSDHETAKKIAVGDDRLFKCSNPRNYKHHKKFFALIKLAHENQDQFSNFDRFREAVTIAAGYYVLKGNLDGSTRVEAKSISFGSMKQEEFDKLYSSALDVIIKLIGCEREDILENLIEFS